MGRRINGASDQWCFGILKLGRAVSFATGKGIHIDNVPIDLTSDAMNHYFSNIACELNAQFNNTPATWKGPSFIQITSPVINQLFSINILLSQLSTKLLIIG